MIHLVPANKSDAAFLADLESEVMRAHATALWGQFRPAEVSAFDLASTQIIHKSDRRIGYVTVETNEDHVRLSKLYLAPAAQGKGIGAKVLATVRDTADKAGLQLRLSVLTPNQRAVSFCLRQGLQVSETTAERVFLQTPPNPNAA
jgi:GNAT superfamily N-acetyltransferase